MRLEVLSGLLLRQIRLAIALVRSPIFLCPEIAGTIHRCLADYRIKQVWLGKKESDDPVFAKFMEYGVGQDKLLLQHLGARGDTADSNPTVAFLEAFVNSQLYEYLAIVDVGNWYNGMNPRRMAEEAGLDDLYKFVYAPYSSDLHGEWNSIAKSEFTFCMNPLHRYHRIPSLSTSGPSLDHLVQAVEIVDESFRDWEAQVGVSPLERTAADDLLGKLYSENPDSPHVDLPEKKPVTPPEQS